MADPTPAPALPTGPGALQSIVEFILELDKLKGVTRKTRPLGLDRYENSAEHSWQIALLAASLVHHAPGPADGASAIDLDRVIRMLLVHDIGEIDTGDTMVYVVGGWEERKAAERAAARRIFGLLPEPQGGLFLALWLEFEEGASPEARFANAVDRAMPVLLNLANDGQSWRENGISHERVLGRVAAPIRDGCPGALGLPRSASRGGAPPRLVRRRVKPSARSVRCGWDGCCRPSPPFSMRPEIRRSGGPGAARPLPNPGFARTLADEERTMCRNIKTLFNFEPPASAEEVRAAALQFVRKVSGFQVPSKANQPAFDLAVEEIADAASRLLAALVTPAGPRDREVEAAKARARSAERFGRVS